MIYALEKLILCICFVILMQIAKLSSHKKINQYNYLIYYKNLNMRNITPIIFPNTSYLILQIATNINSVKKA